MVIVEAAAVSAPIVAAGTIFVAGIRKLNANTRQTINEIDLIICFLVRKKSPLKKYFAVHIRQDTT